jgi:hypothetical protein
MAALPAGFFDDEAEQALAVKEAGEAAWAASAPRARLPVTGEPEARPQKRARVAAEAESDAPGAADEALRSLLAFADNVPDDILASSSASASEAPVAPVEAETEAEAKDDSLGELNDDELAETTEDEDVGHANRLIRAAETAIGRRRGAPDSATTRMLHSLMERREARLLQDAQSVLDESSPWD